LDPVCSVAADVLCHLKAQNWTLLRPFETSVGSRGNRNCLELVFLSCLTDLIANVFAAIGRVMFQPSVFAATGWVYVAIVLPFDTDDEIKQIQA